MKKKLVLSLAVLSVLSLGACAEEPAPASSSSASAAADAMSSSSFSSPLDSSQGSSSAESSVFVSSSASSPNVSSSEPAVEPEEPDPVIDIQGPSEMVVGETVSFYVFVANSDEKDYAVQIDASSTAEAVIEGNQVTASSEGDLVLVASLKSNPAVSDTLTLTVHPAGPTDEEIGKLYTFEESYGEDGETVVGYVISKYTGTGLKELTLPSTFKGKPVIGLQSAGSTATPMSRRS